METTTLLLLCFATFTIHFANGQAKPDPITCTAGNFTRTPSASITCHFNQDIKKNKKNFNVVQYPHKTGAGPSNDAGNYVLVCNWGEGDSLQCKVEDGYTFDENVTDSLTLGIPAVETSVGGVYVCQMVPDGGVPLETCALNVLEALPPASGGYCPSPVSCPDSSSSQGILIAVLVFVLVVLILLGIFVFVYVRMHYRLEKKSGDPAHDRCGFCGFTLALSGQSGEHAAPFAAASNTSHKDKPAIGDDKEESQSLLGGERREDASQKDLFKPASGDGDNSQKQEIRGPPKNAGTGSVAAGNQKGGGGSKQLETSPTVSPPPNAPSTTKGALNMKEKHQPLEEDQSDAWTMEQVCQWLEREGFGKHVDVFTQKAANGKVLLDFNYRVGLWNYGVGGGDDGDDRKRLLQKIESLKKAVNNRKAKMASQQKPLQQTASQQKPLQQTASQRKTGHQKPASQETDSQQKTEEQTIV